MTTSELIQGVNEGSLIITTASELSRMVDLHNKKKNKKELTTLEVSNELGVSTRTLKRRLKESGCRLVITDKGGKGRTNSMMFLRSSVELEKNRIR